MDDFSRIAWGEEFSVIAISPQMFREEITYADGSPKVDFLFVESAWNGNNGRWQYHLSGENAPSKELMELIDFCRSANIPTAFWAKEDPPHYDDFVSVATLFDHVFTTAAEKLSDYTDLPGRRSVSILPFAAQTSVHNPIKPRSTYRKDDVCFAGMYFAEKFPDRQAQIEILVSGAAEAVKGDSTRLTIFSRFEGHHQKYNFPAKFQKYVRRGIPYSHMLLAYKRYKVILNVNSVVSSKTMCSRRVFEAIASGATVVSTPTPALENLFKHHWLPLAENTHDTALLIRALLRSDELRDRTNHLLQRQIWNEHTYSDRARDVVFKVLGEYVPSVTESSIVSVITSTNRPEQVDHIFGQVMGQEGVKVEFNLLCHGFKLDERHQLYLKEKFPNLNFNIIYGAPNLSLGQCLNRLVATSTGDFIAKMDDDDIYGSHYLSDYLHAWSYSGADLLGKQAVYVYLEGYGVTVLKSPEREKIWTDFVAGPTLFGPRKTFEDVPFQDRTRGEDTAFISDVLRKGKKLFSSDRFNFVQVRHDSKHTWELADLVFLANSDVKAYGSLLNHINF
ncbi:hypothetical protein CPHO_03620 [Corynebacterium phocae]|uniref:Spore protein YkvP/CgeB glycosyl transferase-like domain-containing protein n=2 Tax=Corynebacterium phocae TaxID=161895 RepID=A0A1L7D6M9_9CORY|nr:hypothetical protein CPHO_03620 [Corynebacterium phocae]KAA8726549.1 glycosyltransferase [Corynebacterium phocae]